MTRYAIYFMPRSDAPLGAFGNALLGRCPASARRASPVQSRLHDSFADWMAMTATPRRYGFHATLKAPFCLTGGTTEHDLLTAVSHFASEHAPATLGALRIARLKSFVALIEDVPSGAVADLAANTVSAFDRFRAPLTAEDRARRMKAKLSPREVELLDAWGYPYVMEAFRFHMTLTAPLDNKDAARATELITGLFADVPQPRAIEALTVAKQIAPDQNFEALARFDLTGATA